MRGGLDTTPTGEALLSGPPANTSSPDPAGSGGREGGRDGGRGKEGGREGARPF